MKYSVALPILGLLAALGVGCGDDDDSGSSLESNKQVSMLDSEEKQVLKDEIEEKFDSNDIVNDACLYVGILSKSFGANCEEAVTSCKQEAAEDSTEDVSDAEFEELATNCNATVGDVLKCMEDTVNALSSVVDGKSCSSDASELGEFKEPTSCSFTSECKLADEYADQLDQGDDEGTN